MLNEQISTQFKNLSVELNKTVDDKEILQYNIVEVMKMIQREHYIEQVRPFYESDLIKIITGIRRCGKSVIMEQIIKEMAEKTDNIIYLNFEDKKVSANLTNADQLISYIEENKKDGKCYLFFDEIPEVKDWEKCINSLRVSLNCDIYITGSNAKLLSSELSTYLGGRYVEFIIYPFSFAEFLELYRPIAPDEPIQKCFQKYLLSGTFAPGL